MGGAGFLTGVKLNINLEETPMESLILRSTQSFRKTSNWIVDTFLLMQLNANRDWKYNTRQIEEQRAIS